MNNIKSMKSYFFIFLIMLVVLIGFLQCILKGDGFIYVVISIEYGDMKVKLYNFILQYWDNFIKLVKEGFYDDLFFYWVIQDFMIQGGDLDFKMVDFNQMFG